VNPREKDTRIIRARKSGNLNQNIARSFAARTAFLDNVMAFRSRIGE
jgi:hypothetical protein